MAKVFYFFIEYQEQEEIIRKGWKNKGTYRSDYMRGSKEATRENEE